MEVLHRVLVCFSSCSLFLCISVWWTWWGDRFFFWNWKRNCLCKDGGRHHHCGENGEDPHGVAEGTWNKGIIETYLVRYCQREDEADCVESCEIHQVSIAVRFLYDRRPGRPAMIIAQWMHQPQYGMKTGLCAGREGLGHWDANWRRKVKIGATQHIRKAG